MSGGLMPVKSVHFARNRAPVLREHNGSPYFCQFRRTPILKT
jgi:hypothetical protein